MRQDLTLGWRVVVATVTGFAGAALGSAGGVGGGSIFIPTVHLIIGFDTKSSTALSKCKDPIYWVGYGT